MIPAIRQIRSLKLISTPMVERGYRGGMSLTRMRSHSTTIVTVAQARSGAASRQADTPAPTTFRLSTTIIEFATSKSQLSRVSRRMPSPPLQRPSERPSTSRHYVFCRPSSSPPSIYHLLDFPQRSREMGDRDVGTPRLLRSATRDTVALIPAALLPGATTAGLHGFAPAGTSQLSDRSAIEMSNKAGSPLFEVCRCVGSAASSMPRRPLMAPCPVRPVEPLASTIITRTFRPRPAPRGPACGGHPASSR